MRTLGRQMRGALWAAVALAAIVVGLSSATASANHNKGTYGEHGYVWFARYDDNAIAWISSNRCYPREDGAWERVRSSTVDASYTRAKWPSGIRLSTQRCDGAVDSTVDIVLEYRDNFETDGEHGNYGGHNHSNLASSSWCNTIGASWPCGYHISRVHLNDTRFGNSGYSNAYKERLLMHETGHSLGLGHHCESNSIMNDGLSGCNGGAWTSVMTYQATDRQGINQTYPGWKYP
jgi:hypothetical protein